MYYGQISGKTEAVKTYAEARSIAEKGRCLYVAVVYPDGAFEWLPIDKSEYVRQLSLIETKAASMTPYPCHIEIGQDGDVFIDPRRPQYQWKKPTQAILGGL